MYTVKNKFYSKRYALYSILLIAGVILSVAAMICRNMNVSLRFYDFLGLIGIGSLMGSLFIYSSILNVLKKVAHIEKKDVIIAYATYILVIFGLYLVQFNNKLGYVVIILSVMFRYFSGVMEIDNSMKDLCLELDDELYNLALENDKDKE